MSSRRTLVIRLRRASDVERLGRDQFINRDALSCSAGESGADAGTGPMREVYCARIRDAAASAALDGAQIIVARVDHRHFDDTFDANACVEHTYGAVEHMAARCGVEARDILYSGRRDDAIAAVAPLVFAHRTRKCATDRDVGDVVSHTHDTVVDALRVACDAPRKSMRYSTDVRAVGRGDAIESSFENVNVTTIFHTRTTHKPRRATTWRRWLPRDRSWPETRRTPTLTLNERVVTVDTLTVATMVRHRADDVAADRKGAVSVSDADALNPSWACARTGSIADCLTHTALVCTDGRATRAASGVHVGDVSRLRRCPTFTYVECVDRAARAAAFMRDVLDIRPGDVVGVLSSNSIEVFVIHYACAMLRCVLLNLNTHLVRRESAYILADAGCKAVFARAVPHADVLRDVMMGDGERRDRSDVPRDLVAIVWIYDDDDDEVVDGTKRSSPYIRGVRNFDWHIDVIADDDDDVDRAIPLLTRAIAAHTDAHLYYTSGTTGNPKGVRLSHAVVRAHADATAVEMRIGLSDTWLHAAPMFHLVDAFAIYCVTHLGGRHVFLQHFEPARALRCVAAERVTCCNFASSMVAIMSHNPACAACDLSSLRVVSCGGSPLPPTSVRRAIALFGCEFFISYGMTECCGKISMSVLSSAFLQSSTPREQLDAICTSGRPFALMRVKVVDDARDGGALVPCDGRSVGDVYVKGLTVFAEYWRNPDATRRAFDQDGWFATGDLAYVRPDGALVIVDRKKDMILSGGENVYCVEVERVLCECPAVARAAAFGVPHSVMGEVVHAMVTLTRESENESEDEVMRMLDAHCLKHLSQFKCPSAFHIVDALPMNASGKVLKTALREMVANASRGRRSGEGVMRRQFSRAVLAVDANVNANAKKSTSMIDAYEVTLETLAGDDDGGHHASLSSDESSICLRGQTWHILGAHPRVEYCLRALDADVRVRCADDFDAVKERGALDWLFILERYASALADVRSGDTIVLAECLRCFSTTASDASAQVAASTALASGLLLALAQALVAHISATRARDIRVVVLTSNAFVSCDTECTDDGHIAHSAVMAMLRVLRREHGDEVSFYCLDAPHDFDHLASSALRSALRRMLRGHHRSGHRDDDDDDDDDGYEERELVLRDAVVAAPRLRARASPMPTPAPNALRSMSGARPPRDANSGRASSCVIIGGLGALGVLHFEFLSARLGVERFVLVGRSVRDAALQSVTNAMLSSPEGDDDDVEIKHRSGYAFDVDVVAADCADERQSRAVFALAHPVALVLHLGGVLHERAAIDMTRTAFIAGTEAKISGSLHAACDAASDVFMCSSSIFGVLGQSRLASYAASNAFQDALCAMSDRAAHRRRGSGAKRFIAVAFGTWAEVGMAHESGEGFERYWRSVGMGFVAPSAALEFIGAALANDAGSSSAACVGCFSPGIDWGTYERAVNDASAFLKHVTPKRRRLRDGSSSPSLSSSSSEPRRSVALPEDVISRVRRCVCDALRCDDDDAFVDDDAPLSSMGLTSARVVALGEALSREFQDARARLSATVAFDYPTIRELAGFIMSYSGDARSGASVRTTTNAVEDVVRMTIRDVLGVDAAERLDVDTPLMALGLTSARAIQWTAKLSAALCDVVDVDVPATLAFDYPTTRDVVKFLTRAESLASSAPALVNSSSSSSDAVVCSSAAATASVIVVIVASSAGYACAPSADAIAVVPLADRWDADADALRCRRRIPPFGAFIADAALLDAHACGIVDTEARVIDPQQRVILRAATPLMMMEPDGRRGCSVHVGVSQIEYQTLTPRDACSPYYATSAHLSVVAGRVSYTFALTGRAEAIDTACSSSLVAARNASRGADINSHTEFHAHALAGGVNLMFDVAWTIACDAANMLASDGRCKTFDAEADGYVRAEFYALVKLTLAVGDARSGTRTETGVVELAHVAVNQDGRSSSLTAPNGPSQTRVIREAYAGPRIPVESVCLHGTGTPLGDPIELGALRSAAAEAATDDERWTTVMRVCAVKSSIGHSEPASGVAGMLCAVESLSHKTIHAMIHVRALNAHLNAAASSVVHATVVPRIVAGFIGASSASASAFAFQGTNAHGLARSRSSSSSVVGRTAKPHGASSFWLDERAHWLARRNHAWIRRADVAYGRILYVARAARGCQRRDAGGTRTASLHHHVIHGRAIAPATALIELFLESAMDGSRSVGSDVVIPHPLRLSAEDDAKDAEDVVIHVLVRKHDGRASVTTGPLCRPHTHLFGRIVVVHVVDSRVRSSSFAFARDVKVGIRRRQKHALSAKIARRAPRDCGLHVDVYALDAAIHLAEGVLQHRRRRDDDDWCPAARVPAALAAVRPAPRTSSSSSSAAAASSSRASCACPRGIALDARVVHEHWMPDVATLDGLDIRPPRRMTSSTKTKTKTKAKTTKTTKTTMYVTRARTTDMTPSRIFSHGNIARGVRAPMTHVSAARATASLTQRFAAERRVVNRIAVRTTTRTAGGNVMCGAMRSAAHEITCAISCVDVHASQVNAPTDVDDGDVWTTPTEAYGARSIRMLDAACVRRDGGGARSARHELRWRDCTIRARESRRRVMIFGGLGALGRRCAQSVFSPAASDVRLIGRSGRSRARICAASINNAMMTAVRADYVMREEGRYTMPSCDVALYAGGVLADAGTPNVTYGNLMTVCAPKTHISDAITMARAPSMHVFFSSVTALLGNAGQTAYGAANAHLDARALATSRAGVDCASAQWGAWGGGQGMAAHVEARMKTIGIGVLDPVVGVAALRRIVSGVWVSTRIMSVSAFDWQRYANRHASVFAASAFLKHVVVRDSVDKHSRSASSDAEDDRARVSGAPKVGAFRDDARDVIRDAVVRALGHPPTSDDAPFFELGMDSLGAVEFTTALEQALGDVACPATLVFDYPTPKALERFIVAARRGEGDRETRRATATVTAPVTTTVTANESNLNPAFTIVVAATRKDVPGRHRGDDGVTRVDERWSPGTLATPMFSGFVLNADIWRAFDAVAFGMQRAEVVVMDPQQRLVLTHAVDLAVSTTSSADHGRRRQSIDDAALRAHKNAIIVADDIGVFVGAATCDYRRLVIDYGYAQSPFISTGAAFVSVIPGRVSFALGFSGPSVAIDTACSSGLTALHVASASSSSGSIVAGVNALFDCATSAMFARAGMLASDGRCKTFDASADGYARAEAGTTLALRRQQATSASASVIIVGACAVNQDGRSSSLTAPNGPSQTSCIRAAMRATLAASSNNANAARRGCEAHGTGTPLGDPIEIAAALATFDASIDVEAANACPTLAAKTTTVIIGATKASVAHAESPSGLISLVDACETLMTRVRVGTPHTRALNPYVTRAFDAAAPTTAVPVVPRTRIAATRDIYGVSAFAFQGTNAHGVVFGSGRGHGGVARTRTDTWDARDTWCCSPPCSASHGSPRIPLAADRVIFVVRAQYDACGDHCVRERAIFPAAGTMELASGALTSARDRGVERCVFIAILPVNEAFTMVCHLVTSGIDVARLDGSRAARAQTLRATPRVESRRRALGAMSSASAPTVHMTVVVRAVIARARGDSRAGEIDAAFHAIAATWRVNDGAKTLRIPATTEAFRLDAAQTFGGHASDIHRALSMSSHVSRDMYTRQLRTKCIERRVRGASVRTCAYVCRRRRVAAGRAPMVRASQGARTPNARRVLSALHAPWTFSRARVTEDGVSYGIYAAMRSVALETATMSRVELDGAETSRASVEQLCAAKATRSHRHRRLGATLSLTRDVNVVRYCECMVIMGGTGALGSCFARDFMPARFSVVLASSRRGRARILPWTSCGERLLCIHTGVVQALLTTKFSRDASTVVHAAGILADAAWRTIAARAAFASVSAKCGTFSQRADDDSRHAIAHVAVFTSIASCIGSLGQAVYAAANEILDARCEAGARRGEPTRAAQFGPWATSSRGMATGETQSRLASLGMPSMVPADAMAMFARTSMYETSLTTTCIARVDWNAYVRNSGRTRDAALFEHLINFSDDEIHVDKTSPKPKPAFQQPNCASKQPTATSMDDILRNVCGIIERTVGAASIPAAKINPNAPLMDVGVDSVSSTELANAISQAFHVSLPSTAIFDYPTARALSTRVFNETRVQSASMIAKDPPLVSGMTPMTPHAPPATTVICIHARCSTESIDADAVRPISRKRWDIDIMRQSNHANVPATFMTHMSNIDVFDAGVFGVHRDEAARCDVQQRLLLRAALDVFGGSGEISKSSSSSLTGVYVGIASRDYAELAARASLAPSAYDATSHFISVAPGRVCFTFDFAGAAIAIDTACSSALVAAHHARVDMVVKNSILGDVLVCGVNVILCPRVTEQFHRARMLSPEGRCKTLDVAADGYVRAEANRAVRLCARKDGDDDDDANDHVGFERRSMWLSLTVRGTAVGQDGRSSALTAPNGPAQSNVIAAAMRGHAGDNANLHDLLLSLHLHGTGTPLGDPIEVNALPADDSPTRLEASKSFIGHAEPASGIVSITAVIAHNAHFISVGVRGLATVNPYVAVVVVAQTHSMALGGGTSVGRHRAGTYFSRAGTSAFAFQGTNAHVSLILSPSVARVGRITTAQSHCATMDARRAWCVPSVRAAPFIAVAIARPRNITSPPCTLTFTAHAMACVSAKDHTVRARALFPGAGMLRAAVAAGRLVLDDAPLAATSCAIPTSLHISAKLSFHVTLNARSGALAMRGGATMTMTCFLSPVTVHVPQPTSRGGFAFANRRATSHQNRAATITRPRANADDITSYIAAVDGTMQLAAATTSRRNLTLRVPVGCAAYVDGGFTTRVSSAACIAPTTSPATTQHHLNSRACIVDLCAKAFGSMMTTIDAESGRRPPARAYAATVAATPSRRPACPSLATTPRDATRTTTSIIASFQCAKPLRWFSTRGATYADGLFKSLELEDSAEKHPSVEFNDGDVVELRAHAAVRRTDVRRRRSRMQPPARAKVRVLVVGGFGGVGALAAQMSRPECRLALVSRTARATWFHDDGDDVTCAMACDAAARTDALADADVVLYAGGALADGALARHSARRVRVVFAPKSIAVAMRSDERAATPTRIITCSSIASAFGAAGQGNYAAANGAMDVDVARRRNAGADARSVQFGPWADVGMATRHAHTFRRLQHMGIWALRAREGVAALWRVTCRANIIAAALDVHALARGFAGFRTFFPSAHTRRHVEPKHDASNALPSTVLDERAIRAIISTCVTQALGTTLGVDDPLMQHGLDSLSAVDLRGAVCTALARSDAPSTIFFDYPTIASAAKALAATSSSSSTTTTSKVKVNAVARRPEPTEPRVSAAASGCAHDATPTADAVMKTPLARRFVDAHNDPINAFGAYAPTHVIQRVDASPFEPTTSVEMRACDPRQRLLIRAVVVCRAIAPMDDTHDIGSYIGASGKDYGNLIRIVGAPVDAYVGVGAEASCCAGRIAFIFALRGQALVIDTACSSSLCAMALANEAMRGAGRIAGACVGGASIMCAPDTHSALASAGMLSPNGRSKTFDATADGYGRAEAVDVITFDARGDHGRCPQGVVVASGRMNQDGRSASLTAPSGAAQRDVIQSALIFADASYATAVMVLYTHGTGTALGDPIEMNAATAAYGDVCRALEPRALKSWRGHAEPASGTAALARIIHALTRDARANEGVCHLRRVNAHVGEVFATARVVDVGLARQTRMSAGWMSTSAASAFAFQGSNAHVILRTTNACVNDVRVVAHAACVVEDRRTYWPHHGGESMMMRVDARLDSAALRFTSHSSSSMFECIVAVAERAFDANGRIIRAFVATTTTSTWHMEMKTVSAVAYSSRGAIRAESCRAYAERFISSSARTAAARWWAWTVSRDITRIARAESGAPWCQRVRSVDVARATTDQPTAASVGVERGTESSSHWIDVRDGTVVFSARGVVRDDDECCDDVRRRRRVCNASMTRRVTYDVLDESATPRECRLVGAALSAAQLYQDAVRTATTTTYDALNAIFACARAERGEEATTTHGTVRDSALVPPRARHPHPTRGGVQILGGTGGLGVAIARVLLASDCDVRLVARRGRCGSSPLLHDGSYSPSPRRVVTASSADASSRADVNATDLLASRQHFRVVLHASGVLRDAAVRNQTHDALRRVYAPKLTLSRVVLRQSDAAPPASRVFFSSIAASVLAPGQANYAAANAALDAYALDAYASGLDVRSIRWGAFDYARGMASASGTTEARLERVGLRALPFDIGAHILMRVISHANDGARHPCVVVSPMIERRRDAEPTTRGTPVSNPHVVIATALDVVRDIAQSLVGKSLECSAPMMDAGLDSIASVELRRRVSSACDVDLPATVAFDFPTIDALAAYVDSKRNATTTQTTTRHGTTRVVVDDAPRLTMAFAVVARAGRFRPVADPATRVPVIRWTIEPTPAADADAGMRFGVFLPRVDAFDRALFAFTSIHEAERVDPQHRGFLECVFECATSTPYGDDTNVIVAVGAQHMEYSTLYAPYIAPSAHSATGSALSACAGRTSYTFGYVGACFAVDTACSASLVTVHIATHAATASCTFAMCGGVNYLLSKRTSDAIAAARMLSSDGRCKTMDARADGYGRAESVAAMALMRWRRHPQPEHNAKKTTTSDATTTTTTTTMMVVRASACGQDGRSAALTAPNGAQQRRVMRDAYTLAHIDRIRAREVSMHGTGTPLGDPIECGAIAETFGDDMSTSRVVVALSASKTSAGHGEAAAGAIALERACAACDAVMTPVIVGLARVNAHVERAFARESDGIGCVAIPRTAVGGATLTSSEEDISRVVGCSAFAFTGTNVHAVLCHHRRHHQRGATSARGAPVVYARESLWLAPTPAPALEAAADVALDVHRVVIRAKRAEGAAVFSCEAAARLMFACADALGPPRRDARERMAALDVVVGSRGTSSGSSDMSLVVNVRSGRVRAKDAAYARVCRATTRGRGRGAVRMVRWNLVRQMGGGRALTRHRGDVGVGVGVTQGSLPTSAIAAYVGRTMESLSSHVDDHDGGGLREMSTAFGEETMVSFTGETALGCQTSPKRSIPRRVDRPNAVFPMTTPSRDVVNIASVVYDALRDVFGEDVGAKDDLMAMGVDSIGAVELATTLKRAIKIDEDIDVATLATQPTPLKMIAYLEHLVSNSNPSSMSTTTTKTASNAKANVDMVKCLKSQATTPNALFLGAPAFGDGPLAYMKLVDALSLGAHPVLTLERDTTEQPWPDAANAHAFAMHAQQDDDSPIILGGHSLGGVLAIESALVLENVLDRTVSLCFLFDAPHPVQFKSDWNDIPDENTTDDDESPDNESTGLMYMEVALSSFHFDTVAAGWQNLSREEKYAMFEDVAHQALGRAFNARELDEQISKGPYAAQWNSGMNQLEDGSIDSGAWRMLRGVEADPALSSRVPRKMFSRVRGKVIHYKAGTESSALFETDLRLDAHGGLLQSVSGYVWPLACDHVEIVHCAGSHMNLMTSESNGGDLDETIVPHMRQQLASEWDDLGHHANARVRADVPWIQSIWHPELGLSMSASPSLVFGSHGRQTDATDDDDDDASPGLTQAIVRAVDCEEYFDACAFGLNHDAVWTVENHVPRVWLLVDVLADVERWSFASFASTLPVHGIHLPRTISAHVASSSSLNDQYTSNVAARCVKTILNATSSRRAPVVVCALAASDASARIAFEIALQLNRRGCGPAIAVVIDDGSSKYERQRRDETSRAEYQALAATLADTEHPAGWRALPQFLTERRRARRYKGDKTLLDAAKVFVRAQRPLDVTPHAWSADIEHAVRACEALVDVARHGFFPKLILAHAFVFASSHT